MPSSGDIQSQPLITPRCYIHPKMVNCCKIFLFGTSQPSCNSCMNIAQRYGEVARFLCWPTSRSLTSSESELSQIFSWTTLQSALHCWQQSSKSSYDSHTIIYCPNQARRTCTEPVWRSVMKCNERAVMFYNGAGSPIGNGWGRSYLYLPQLGPRTRGCHHLE